MSEILLDALSVVRGYLIQNYNKGEQDTVWNEIFEVTRNRAGDSIYPKGAYEQDTSKYGYEKTQEILSCLNEKESIRKTKGVYPF